ncbi:MAG: hypothetical protein ABI665_11980 [Vicinamibacterales bacterium]
MSARSLLSCVALAICFGQVSVRAGQDAAAQNGIVQQWSVRVARPLALEAPIKGFVTNEADFSHLWQVCQIKGDAPTIDFGQYLILVATSRSSVFKVRAIQVDDTGDLKTVVIATPDFARDYAFVITQVERAGVKSVHGQAIGQ